MKIIPALVLCILAASAGANPPWSPAVKSADVGNSINEGESCIAFDGDYIYCVCNVVERESIPVIPYGRSTDGGSTWTTNWFVDSSGPDLWHSDPIILTDDTGYVHMFIQFSTDLLRHYLSTDRGVTWCDTTDVSIPGDIVDKPWACYYGTEMYACWQQLSTPYGIAFAKSTNGGRSWDVNIIDSRTYLTGIDVSPSGNIHISLRTSRRLYAFKSTDGGETWPDSLKKTIDSNCRYSGGWGDRAPLTCIAAPTDDNIVVTVVDDRGGNWDILHSYSTDGGLNWSALANLNDSTAGGQCKGWLEADVFGRLHALWYHTPSWPTSITSQWSVRYQYSDDFGANWSSSIRLSDTTFTSPVDFMGEYHIMQSDSTWLRCVWTDGREGDLDLWFAQARLDQIGIEEDPFQTRPLLPSAWVRARPLGTRGRFEVDYGLVRAARVELQVFDPVGRELVRERLGRVPPGPHSHPLDLSRAAAGPVFVRLKLDSGETVAAGAQILR